MRFLCVFKSVNDPSSPASPEAAVAMSKLIDEMTTAGVLLATELCMDSSHGARIRVERATPLNITDGALTGVRELVSAVLLIQLQTKAEAVSWCKRFLAVAGEGEVELRQLFDAPV